MILGVNLSKDMDFDFSESSLECLLRLSSSAIFFVASMTHPKDKRLNNLPMCRQNLLAAHENKEQKNTYQLVKTPTCLPAVTT